MRLRRGLASQGRRAVSTANGLQFAMNALHPCNEMTPKAAMYPDDGHMPLHATRMQRTITVANPTTTCDTKLEPNVDQCSWNLLVLTTPWPEYPWLCYACAGNNEPVPLSEYLAKGKTIYNGDRAGVHVLEAWYTFTFPNFQSGAPVPSVDNNDLRSKYQRIRVVGKGTTTYLNASRLYDGGRVICGQYPVASRFVDTFDSAAYKIDLATLLEAIKAATCVSLPALSTDSDRTNAEIIKVVKGHGHALNGTDRPVVLSDDVRTLTGHRHVFHSGLPGTAASTEPPSYDSTGNSYTNIVSARGTQSVTGDVYISGMASSIPVEADEPCVPLTVTEPNSTAVVKLVRDTTVASHPDWYVSDPPVQENALFYGDSKATTWEARKGTYQPMRVENYDLSDCNTGDATFYSLTDAKEREIASVGPNSFALNTQGTGTWMVAYYRNISNQSSVTLKCVQFTDGVVNPAGPFANLTPLHADPDPEAIAFVSEEARRLAHAYPANFNDLGSILGEIFNVAKGIGKAVKGVSESLTGVPVIGDIAGTIGSILGSIGL